MDWKAELLKRLDILAAKLGTTSVYLWSVLVRQGIAEGIANCIIAVLLFVVFIVALRYVFWFAKKGYTDTEKSPFGERWKDQYFFGLALTSCLTALAFGIGLRLLYTGVLELVNPAYFALTQILQAIK